MTESRQILKKTNGPWYTLDGYGGFDRGYFLGWSNSGFDEDTVFYIDNVEFSTTSLIGTVISAPKIAAPKPPVLFTKN